MTVPVGQDAKADDDKEGEQTSEIRAEVERRLKRLAKGNDNDEEAKN